MARKKNLERAVVLGLLLSTSVYSSAWAWISDSIERSDSGSKDFENHVISGDSTIFSTDESGIKLMTSDGGSENDVNYTLNFDSLKIDIVHKNNPLNNKGYIAGIRTDSYNKNANLTINSNDFIDVKVTSRNNYAVVGVWAQSGDTIKLDSASDIKITAIKESGINKSYSDALVKDEDETLHAVYGLNVSNNPKKGESNGGSISLQSDGSIYVTAESKSQELNNSYIYAIGNDNGNIELIADGTGDKSGAITLSSTANNNNTAIGLDSWQGKQNKLKAADGILISAKAAAGDAFGVKVSGGGTNNEFNSSYNVIQGESETGAAYGIKIEDGSTINISGISGAENNQNYISGIVTGNPVEEEKFGIGIDADNSTVNIKESDYNRIEGTDYGIRAENSSTISFDGVTYAIAKNGTAISLTNSNMTVNDDEFISGNNGLVIDSSQHNVTCDLIGRADNIAVNVMGENSNLTVGGNILVEGGNIGVTVENNTITVNGGDGTGANVIKSNSGNALKAVESTVTLNAGANGANSIVAGEIFGAEGVYYTGTAINATSASNGAENNRTGGSEIDVLGSENFIGGTVRANGVESIVNIGGSVDDKGNLTSGGNNYITSAAHGRDGSSNEDVVSAVFAQNGANVNIKASEGQRNYIIAQSENIEPDKTNESDKPKYNERAVWAQGGSQVNIEGETIISASKAEVEFENGIPKNITLDDLRNNNLGIAIAAGTGEITGITDPGDLVENIPEGVGKSTINLNYKGSSVILGDVVSGWNGLVNIGDGIETSSNGSKLNFYGSAMAANGGQINLDLGEGGVWYGRADDYQDAHVDGEGNTFFNPAFSNEIIDNGTVNLKMGTGSAWYVQGQSWISNITIDENAENTLIDLVSANTDHNSTAHALTIGELNGNTTFHMSLDGNRTTSDMLYIKEANGDYIVTLEEAVQTADMYTDGTNRFNGLRFATIGAGSNADFRVFSSDTGFYDVEYQVEREEYDVNSYENHHYNTSDGNVKGDADMEKPGDGSLGDFFGDSESGAETQNAKIALLDEVSTNDEKNQSNISADNVKIVGRIGEQMSDAAQTILNMSRANYSNAIYMDRLNKRMGEARYLNDEENEGMWVRLRHDRIGKDDAFRRQNTMYEIGYDVKQECDNGERRIGMAIDYMHGDTGYSDISGKGEIDRCGLWLYDTWLGNKGHYVDYVAKWGHLSNDFELYTMSRGEKVTGDYSNNVFSISAEYGKKNDMGNDWYFEPQIQAQLARVTGAEYETSQGTKVSVDGINSLIGRAGFRIGKDFGAEKQSTVYLKADVLHEFLGDQDIHALDDSTDGKWADVSYENEGTWYDVGFGFATQLSKASYAFMDFEKSFGNDNDETYQINVGMQWSF